MSKRLIVDPPWGWKYGFPMELKEGQDYRQLLLDNGYPEGEIDFAMRYTRQWKESDE